MLDPTHFENKILFRDSSGKKSVTMTSFILGFCVVNVKLLLSGVKFGTIAMSTFTGSEYGMALSALGAIYVLRRNTTPKKEGEDKPNG